MGSADMFVTDVRAAETCTVGVKILPRERVADAVGVRAAAATTVVCVEATTTDRRRGAGDDPPVALGVTAVRRATTVLDRTSKLQNVTWSP